MKIKWRIVLSLSSILIAVIFLINFFFYKSINQMILEETSEELTNYSVLGLSLIDSKYPGDWRLDGDKLYKGDTLINENYEIVDLLADKTGILATIFAGETRVSTTVTDDNGKRQIGTKASDAVIEKVLKQKQEYIGSAVVVNTDANTLYTPLLDKDGTTVGIWFVGIYSDIIQIKIRSTILSITGYLSIALIIGIILSYLIGQGIAKAVEKIRLDIKSLEEGNFATLIEKDMTNRKDELGDISRSFANMQERIRSIILSIKTETAHIEEASLLLAEGSHNVYSDVEEISATTEELSAGMEETAASTEEMNATSVEIESEINRVSNKASNGQFISSEIKERAGNLKKIAFESEKTAVEIYNNTIKKIRQSLEKAGAIEEIQALSKTILNITAQTNLLALNASIESARAGEAGKGFAVVANEIATLARNSKNAVSKIEEISLEISNAVNSIVEDSKMLLEFMDNKVIKDYNLLVQTGEQYDNDAKTIEDMVKDISTSTVQLNKSIHYIHEAINEITQATEEGSKGATDIANKSTNIFHKTNQVLEQANINKEIAANLNEMVQFFQI